MSKKKKKYKVHIMRHKSNKCPQFGFSLFFFFCFCLIFVLFFVLFCGVFCVDFSSLLLFFPLSILFWLFGFICFSQSRHQPISQSNVKPVNFGRLLDSSAAVCSHGALRVSMSERLVANGLVRRQKIRVQRVLYGLSTTK